MSVVTDAGPGAAVPNVSVNVNKSPADDAKPAVEAKEKKDAAPKRVSTRKSGRKSQQKMLNNAVVKPDPSVE